jgi:hypothetical protein
MNQRPFAWAASCIGLLATVLPLARGWSQDSGTDRPGSQESAHDRDGALRMSPAVVCRSIDGYEAYEELPDAALTADEKLLLYFRPLGHKIDLADGYYRCHLIQDAQIRKRGQKAIVQQKLKLLEYKPKSRQPPRYIYLRDSISLKGLAPGEYDLTVILHDELAKGPPATQVVKFRVIPAQDPRKAEKKASPAGDRSSPEACTD